MNAPVNVSPETFEPLSTSEQLQYATKEAAENLSGRMFNKKLAALRAQNPFITILTLPNSATTVALAAGVAQYIDVPEGAKLMMLSGNDKYFLTRNGQAQLPTASVDKESGSIMNPEAVFWSCEDLKQISVIAQNATDLTIGFWMQMG